MVGLPDGEKTLRICVTVYTQYRHVMDGRTDRQMDGRTDILPRHSPHYAYGLRGKNGRQCSVSLIHIFFNNNIHCIKY